MILALLLAVSDLCTVVKHVVRTSVVAFDGTKGTQHEDSPKKVVWTAPIQLPGASVCKVIEYRDGAQPFYGCEMAAPSCGVAEARFGELVKDVSRCLDAPVKLEEAGNKRTARLHKGGVPVRALFIKGTPCELRFFVEPIQQDRR